MSNRKKSVVWNHFDPTTTPGYAKCKLCKNLSSNQGGSTSNMMRHLRSQHPTVLLTNTQAEAEGDTDPAEDPAAAGTSTAGTTGGAATAAAAGGTSSTSATATPATVRKRQRQTTMGAFIKKPMAPHQRQKVDNALISMIAKDFQPFSVVDDEGFKEFTAALDPSYTLPSRHTLSRKMLPALYDKVRAELMTDIQKASAVCLTTDCWTSRTTTSYMSVTCHYIADDFSLKSNLLDCFTFAERHTAEQLAFKLNQVTEEWKIKEKVVACVTDNATNIKKAVKEVLKWNHVSCFAHSLNLVVRHALDHSADIMSIVKKVKAMSEYIRRSTVASDKLRHMQQSMGQPQLRPKMDVVTRWNSTFYMLQRIRQIKEPLISTLAILNPQEPTLSHGEWEALDEACAILAPFEEVTREMSSERYVGLLIFYYIFILYIPQYIPHVKHNLFVIEI